MWPAGLASHQGNWLAVGFYFTSMTSCWWCPFGQGFRLLNSGCSFEYWKQKCRVILVVLTFKLILDITVNCSLFCSTVKCSNWVFLFLQLLWGMWYSLQMFITYAPRIVNYWRFLFSFQQFLCLNDDRVQRKIQCSQFVYEIVLIHWLDMSCLCKTCLSCEFLFLYMLEHCMDTFFHYMTFFWVSVFIRGRTTA